MVRMHCPLYFRLRLNNECKDYNIEYAGAKATAMINLVKSLKSQGVPIDGIGVQGRASPAHHLN